MDAFKVRASVARLVRAFLYLAGGRWRDAIGPKVGERRIAKARSGPHNGSHGTFNKGEEHEKFDGSFDVGGWTYRDASARQLFDWERVGRVLLRR